MIRHEKSVGAVDGVAGDTALANERISKKSRCVAMGQGSTRARTHAGFLAALRKAGFLIHCIRTHDFDASNAARLLHAPR